MNEILSKELIELAEKDLFIREKLAAEGKLFKGYHPEMGCVHKENAVQLRHIIEEIGFPTISKVGEKASGAAWLIIQHAIGEPEFMKMGYEMMIENSNDINPSNIAHLYDRIQVFQSKPQRFGTQLTAEGAIYPVEDKNTLNYGRLQVNLPLLSEDEINRIPLIEDIPEIDGKDPDGTLWRIKNGWISEKI